MEAEVPEPTCNSLSGIQNGLLGRLVKVNTTDSEIDGQTRTLYTLELVAFAVEDDPGRYADAYQVQPYKHPQKTSHARHQSFTSDR